MDEIINRVAQSSLITIDLEKYLPQSAVVEYDLKANLFQGLLLREKDFRAFIKTHDWSQYEGKIVALFCSSDAIVPVWAYMLLSSELEPYASRIIFGTRPEVENILWKESLNQINPSEFEGEKVIIKGCGQIPIPESAYVEMTRLLSPVVSSLMYGEACSSVPIMKKRKNTPVNK